jgi:hypothetical protein
MAKGLDIAVADDGQTVRAGQLHQGVGLFGQRLSHRPVWRQPRKQFVLHPAQARALAIEVGVGLGLQLSRQITRQGRAAHAQLIGQQLR